VRGEHGERGIRSCFGNCTAMTELAGRPDSMKCAASVRDRAIGLRKGQPLRCLAGNPLLVEGIEPAQERAAVAQESSVKTAFERR